MPKSLIQITDLPTLKNFLQTSETSYFSGQQRHAASQNHRRLGPAAGRLVACCLPAAVSTRLLLWVRS